MRDDRLPLASYGLTEGSRIGLVGSREEGDRPGAKTSAGIGALSIGEQKAREKKAKESDTSEQGLMNRITEALETARKDLFPEVEKVERVASQKSSTNASTNTNTAASEEGGSRPAHKQAQDGAAGAAGAGAGEEMKMNYGQVADAHRRLSELLLRQLLALDGVNVNSDTTRQARKIAVKEVQSHLDRLDAAWSSYKGAHDE